EFFALIPPALGCSLEPLEIELELVTDPGGGSVAQRRARLTLREQRRRALEVLGSVSQRWQRSRDELRDTQASGGPTWLLHRQSESGQLASLLGAQVRSSVLLVGDESSGRQALLQRWFEAAAGSGRAADVYATSAAQLLAGMSG